MRSFSAINNADTQFMRRNSQAKLNAHLQLIATEKAKFKLLTYFLFMFARIFRTWLGFEEHLRVIITVLSA